MSQTTERRCARILERLQARRHVAVRDICDEFGVSAATARRDLRRLAERGVVRIVHGGARLESAGGFGFDAKTRRQTEAKRLVGELAARLVVDGDQVFLDAGTTSYELAVALTSRERLSVICQSLRLPRVFAGTTSRLLLLGGQYRPDRGDTVGPVALRALEPLRGFRAFVGADGLSVDGPSSVDIESADLYHSVLEHAVETILVVDHSKFRAPALYPIAPWDRIDRVVTDRAPGAEWQAFFRDRGIRLVCGDDTAAPAVESNPA